MVAETMAMVAEAQGRAAGAVARAEAAVATVRERERITAAAEGRPFVQQLPDHFTKANGDQIPFADIASGTGLAAECGFGSREEAERAVAAAAAAGYVGPGSDLGPPDGEASDTDGAEEDDE